MRTILVLSILTSIVFESRAQSYVDSGIQHFSLGEYDEALVDFKEAEEIMSMITESSKAKVYYYRGMIWLDKAEKSSGEFAEEDPLTLCFNDLSKVMYLDSSWETAVQQAYERLYPLIVLEADEYLKLEKKESKLAAKLDFLDVRINYLVLADKLGMSTDPQLFLGITNKQAGDLIYESSTGVAEMQKAEKYYVEALKYFEVVRYEDPFSKKILKDLLAISTRLGDEERVKEYEELLRLAGG